MAKSKFNDLLEIILSDKPSKEKLQEMGITEKDLENFNNKFSDNFISVVYNRILTIDEKRALTPDAFDYILDLIRIRSIDKSMAEDFILYSTQLSEIISTKVNKKMMDEIINYVKFSGTEYVTANDIIELFLIRKDFIHFKGNIN